LTSTVKRLTDFVFSVSNLVATSSPVCRRKRSRASTANSGSWAQYNTTRGRALTYTSTPTATAQAISPTTNQRRPVADVIAGPSSLLSTNMRERAASVQSFREQEPALPPGEGELV